MGWCQHIAGGAALRERQETEAAIRAICELLSTAAATYGPLLVLVGPSGSGKTSLLLRLTEQHSGVYHNVNLELASTLPDGPPTQSIPGILHNIADNIPGKDILFLDHIELLFTPSLQLDVLRLLWDLSRVSPIVVAWPGEYKGNKLTYAQPGHPEFREYRQPESWPGVKVLSLWR